MKLTIISNVLPTTDNIYQVEADVLFTSKERKEGQCSMLVVLNLLFRVSRREEHLSNGGGAKISL